jgi:hypothetical protein
VGKMKEGRDKGRNEGSRKNEEMKTVLTEIGTMLMTK